MIVILKEDVKSLGKKGEKVKVADGYGRNYLIPRNLAFEADAGSLQQLKEREEAKAQKGQRDLERAKRLAERLEGLAITIPAKSGEGGKLYGAITNVQIAEELSKQHDIVVDRKKIEMKEAIKMLGIYDIVIRVYPEITAKIKVTVHPVE